ncbi:MAG TPA: carboxypeptidase-like regulatory domain-containing protein, partial [Vicinamibacterales bacterium]
MGRVVDAGNGEPVSDAIVTVLPGSDRVLVDGHGRFLFHSLPKGPITMTAAAAGYVPGGFGERRPNAAPLPIALSDGQQVRDVTIRLWKFAVMSGTVLDESGDAVVGAIVRALQEIPEGGQRRVTSAADTTTDDRGAFRFWSLQPGDFLVVVPSTATSIPRSVVEAHAQHLDSGVEPLVRAPATSAPLPSAPGFRVGDWELQPSGALGRAAPAPTADGRVWLYQTTFYPSAVAPSQAQIIAVGSGEERSGIDVSLQLVRTASVSGSVVGPSGPASNFALRLLPADTENRLEANGDETARTLTDARGAFTLLGVPPGPYVLEGSTISRLALASASSELTALPRSSNAGPWNPTALWTQTTLSVGGADVTGVSLVLHHGLSVTGRLRFEGNTPPPTQEELQHVTLSLTPQDSMGSESPSPGRVNANGAFTIGGCLPGRYTVDPQSPGSPWTLMSVTASGHDLLRTPLVLDSDVSDVVITFTDRPT